MSTRVLVDANVLYSRTLRDWLALLYLESDPFFSVYWTEDILAETVYHLRRDHPEWPGRKTRAIGDKIREVFEGGRPGANSPSGHRRSGRLSWRRRVTRPDGGGVLAAEYLVRSPGTPSR